MMEYATVIYQENRSNASCFGSDERGQDAYLGAGQEDRPEWTGGG
jgi:hypothetical protein